MRFTNDDLPVKRKLTDTVAEEHPKRFVAVAEEQIRAMHHHEDGSSVELHEVGSREFIAQSIGSSLEGKIGISDISDWQQQQSLQNNLAAAKIEYEKKSSQNQPMQLYGAQQSVTGGALSHRQETALVGCNCGAEWTVTGQSTKANNPNNPTATVKIEQYGPAAGKGAGYNASGSGGGGPGDYRAGGGQRQEYKG